MADFLALQKLALKKITEFGQTVTLTWPASGKGSAAKKAVKLVTKGLKTVKKNYITGASFTEIILPVTGRDLTGATLTLGSKSYVVQSADVTSPNDIDVVQMVTLA